VREALVSTSSSSLAPRLVFGAASLGMAYGLPRQGALANSAPAEADAAELVERALALGITTFDTAPAYGESEARLGRILGARGTVWTKVAAGDPAASLAASLSRLRRPSVELLQWHNWTAALGRDAAWTAAWSALRGDPRVARLGATTYGVADAVAAATSGLFEIVQCEFHVLNQGVVAALADHAGQGRVSVAVRSVLLQGALSDDGRALPDLPVLREGVRRARGAAEGVGLTRLAMRAALEHPVIAHVLVGIDRLEQIEEAARIASGPALGADASARLAALDLGGDPACDPRTWPR
jgi:aryl-alcohol dehydrogenase-like predicted oxidoreductase